MASSSSSQTREEEDRDFLFHLEAYLSKRDGVDKLLKISRYAAKIILSSSSSSSSVLSHSFLARLKAFESSVGASRKAFRLGKFVQDINALRLSSTKSLSPTDRALTIVAYGGEGVYYFAEQFVWLVKAGLIPKEYGGRIQKFSAWAELIGYVGSVALKVGEVRRILSVLEMRKEEEGCDVKETNKLRDKLLLKEMSIVQDFADAAMALADVRDGNGYFTGPVLMAFAGFLSAIISTHKNWRSC